jgi:translation initiation factor IF-3
VRVIGADGKQVGIMPVPQALDLAYQSGLDLIEIAPQASPPVCRIQDYGKYRFEQTKREKEARRAQKKVEIKEIRLRPKTGENDIMVRLRAARRFLEEGAKVKVWLRFRGREVTHPELALAVLERIAKELSDISIIEQRAAREGRTMLMVLAPSPGKKRKPESRPAEAGEQATSEPEGEEASSPLAVEEPAEEIEV